MSRRRDPEVLPWTPVTAACMLLVSAVGALTFLWPFAVRSREALAAGNDSPWLFPVLIALLALLLLAQLGRGGLEPKGIATLGVLAAFGGALRVLSGGTTGLEPMFFLVVLGGRVLGRAGGFLLGALAVLTGAFLTGGVGPWLPYQMLAAGWVGLGSALLPGAGPRAERWLLTAWAAFCGLAYGLVMTLWFWPFLTEGLPRGGGFDPAGGLGDQLRSLAVFYGLTSLGWDLPRAVLNAVLVAVAGPTVLRVLRRAVRRAGFAPALPPAERDAPPDGPAPGSVDGVLEPVTVSAGRRVAPQSQAAGRRQDRPRGWRRRHR